MTNEPPVGVVGGLPWRPERLRAERRVNPLGVGTAHPWLDWRLPAEAADATPAGYRVRVATSVAGLAEPDAWDSGWVASTAWACRYGGRPAASRERLWWQVQVRGAAGEVSGWSASACWETGLLECQDWWASWIRPGASAQRPRQDRRVCLARRRFSLAQPPSRARLYVTALGCHEAHLNGQVVGDGLLRPGWTDYTRPLRRSRNATGRRWCIWRRPDSWTWGPPGAMG